MLVVTSANGQFWVRRSQLDYISIASTYVGSAKPDTIAAYNGLGISNLAHDCKTSQAPRRTCSNRH